MEDAGNLPDPDNITAEIVEDHEAAREQLRLIARDFSEADSAEIVDSWHIGDQLW